MNAIIDYIESDAITDISVLIWLIKTDASPDVIQAHLHKNADVNFQDNNNDTALSWAIRKNASLDIIKALFESGADINFIQDLNLREQAMKLFEEIEQQKRLQEFSYAKKVLLTTYHGEYSSVVENSEIPLVLREFLGLKPH